MTVMPEVGCGIDNLEITKRAEHFGSDDSRFENWRHQQQREVAAVDRRVGQKVDLETIFQVDSERDDDGKECPRRIRISLSLDMPQRTEENPTLSKLITLRVERQCSHQSSKGTAWSGPSSNSGGLDARTVMNTIGKDIVYGDVFSVKRTKGGGDLWDIDIDTVEEKDGAAKILDGAWKRAVISPKDDDFMMTKEGYSITFRLPQNVMVRYGASSEEMWGIEVSHFDTIGSDDKMCLRRRVVMRALPLKNGIGSVSYCMEEKEL